jgi:hypothetical protein
MKVYHQRSVEEREQGDKLPGRRRRKKLLKA